LPGRCAFRDFAFPISSRNAGEVVRIGSRTGFRRSGLALPAAFRLKRGFVNGSGSGQLDRWAKWR
jgi:hypothetical protein